MAGIAACFWIEGLGVPHSSKCSSLQIKSTRPTVKGPNCLEQGTNARRDVQCERWYSRSTPMATFNQQPLLRPTVGEPVIPMMSIPASLLSILTPDCPQAVELLKQATAKRKDDPELHCLGGAPPAQTVGRMQRKPGRCVHVEVA